MELRFLSFSFDVPNGRVELMLIFLFRYSLAQEHGDLINLHDWFQAFKTIVLQNTNKRKQKSKQSQLPKKRKDMNGSGNENEASIQYPLYFLFYRASLISIRHNTSDLCHLLLHRHMHLNTWRNWKICFLLRNSWWKKFNLTAPWLKCIWVWEL